MHLLRADRAADADADAATVAAPGGRWSDTTPAFEHAAVVTRAMVDTRALLEEG